MKRSLVVSVSLAVALLAFLAGRYSGGEYHAADASKKRILYYVDPMHPAYKSDKPGIAPDCGMRLEPVYEGQDPSAKLQLSPGAVSISPDRQQLFGLRVEKVQKNSDARTIRTTGRVEADDNRVYRLMSATDGWILSLENNPAGTLVKQNELLATFYSKEFRNAEQAYLGSLASVERIKPTHESDEASRVSDANLRINEEQLRALGMGELQIKDLAKVRQVTRDIRLISPVDGIVLSRSISPEQRFEKGAEFYRIADLSRVWIIADVFGDEGQLFQPGAKVQVELRERARTLTATVSKNPPLFDATTRTLKLRLEADNPGFLLRPDMFVDLEFKASAPAGVSIPQEAVLDSGMRKLVYVEASEGVFEPHEVKTGNPYGNRIMITSGLQEGDRIVTSGNFLVDSESRLRSAPVVASTAPQEVKPSAKQEATVTNQVPASYANRKPDSNPIAAGPIEARRD